MTSKHRYFANEYVGLIVKTEDNQVWKKRVAYPGKKLYVRAVSRLDEIQMKNQSLIAQIQSRKVRKACGEAHMNVSGSILTPKGSQRQRKSNIETQHQLEWQHFR